MNTPKIALLGFYGKHNFGDDLMAYHLPRIVSCNNQYEVQLFSDVDTDNIKNGLKSEDYLEYDIIVIGGGGIIAPNFWAFTKGRLEKLIACKKDICFLNVNVIEDLLDESQFVDKLKTLNARWWVRDLDSVEILKKLGIIAYYLPDVSTLKDVVSPSLRTSENKKLSVFLNSYILENLSSNNVSDFLLAHQNIRVLAKFLDWMIHFNWEVTFYPCQCSPYYDDRISAALTYSLIDNKNKAKWETNSVNWQDMLDEIIDSDLLISMRYHPTIIALSNNIPVIDITHHNKNKHILQQLNLDNLISANYKSLDIDQLIVCAQNAENKTLYANQIDLFKKESTTCWMQFETEWNLYLQNKKRE